jgi:hypothetical protein
MPRALMEMPRATRRISKYILRQQLSGANIPCISGQMLGLAPRSVVVLGAAASGTDTSSAGEA